MSAQVDDELAGVRAQLGWSTDTPGRRCAVTGYDGSSSSAAALAYASGWAERNLGAVVVVHVDAGAELTMAECACAMSGVVVPDLPPNDLSSDVKDAMAPVSARWAYVSVRGDVAVQLERVAVALGADLIVVGRSRRARLRIASSVSRRLLGSTRHIIVVV